MSPTKSTDRLARRIDRRSKRWAKRQARIIRRLRKSRLGEAGTARGEHLEIGAVENGWVIPPPARLIDGTRIRLFKDGQGLRAALEGIRLAKKLILLEVYIFQSDDTGREFADTLAKKASQGVGVYVIYDSFGCFASDPAMFEQMRRAGVHLAEFHPLRPWDTTTSWRPFNRDHRKLLVIDDHLAGLGGLNIGAEYGSSVLLPRGRRCDCWRDNSIAVMGPAARLLGDCFRNTWKYVQRGGAISAAETIHDIDADGGSSACSDFCLLASVPRVRSPLVPLIRNLMRNAQSTIDLSVAYFAPSNVLIEELMRAARRGVRVRLMLAGKSDVRLVWIAARSFYARLLEAGIEIWERQGAVLHTKTMVVDAQTTLIGSTNLDYRSIEYNCELSATLRNRDFGQQVSELFEHDIKFAQRIHLSQWRRRPMRDRIVQWFGNLAIHLI